ncbi:MAG TPA: DUF2971 domain-containing protein [Acidobacteriaceae bacterium]
MPITQDEGNEYFEFTKAIVGHLKSFDFDPDITLWHYTNGAGLLGILQSAQIYATQVACLNDSTETTYAQKLFRDAISEVKKKHSKDETVLAYLSEQVTDDVTQSVSPSKFFVTCFSAEKDDLSQWRAYSETGGENGYAIGFRAQGLFSSLPNRMVAKVNYDREFHLAEAKEVAEATIRFFLKGLQTVQARTPEEWAKEFFAAWDDRVYRLAPLVKDRGFRAENEFRIVHELYTHEMNQVQVRQKRNLLSRHIALNFPTWVGSQRPMLPIVEVMVGPSRHPAVSRVSVGTLLHQMGYANVPVTVSECPLQAP